AGTVERMDAEWTEELHGRRTNASTIAQPAVPLRNKLVEQSKDGNPYEVFSKMLHRTALDGTEDDGPSDSDEERA
ncbi:hypothetical protein M513_12610, partial [Trichuris suis]